MHLDNNFTQCNMHKEDIGGHTRTKHNVGLKFWTCEMWLLRVLSFWAWEKTWWIIGKSIIMNNNMLPWQRFMNTEQLPINAIISTIHIQPNLKSYLIHLLYATVSREWSSRGARRGDSWGGGEANDATLATKSRKVGSATELVDDMLRVAGSWSVKRIETIRYLVQKTVAFQVIVSLHWTVDHTDIQSSKILRHGVKVFERRIWQKVMHYWIHARKRKNRGNLLDCCNISPEGGRW